MVTTLIAILAAVSAGARFQCLVLCDEGDISFNGRQNKGFVGGFLSQALLLGCCDGFGILLRMLKSGDSDLWMNG